MVGSVTATRTTFHGVCRICDWWCRIVTSEPVSPAVTPRTACTGTVNTSNIKLEEAPAHIPRIYAYESGCLGARLYRDWIKNEFLKKHQKLEKKKVEIREAAELAKEREG